MLEVTNVKKEKGGSKMLTKSGKRIVSFGLALAVTGSCFAGILSDPASTQAAKKAKLKTKSMTLEVGKKKTIGLTGKKSKAKYTFQASNKKIKVSKKGVVTAVKKGTAKVKVKEVYKKEDEEHRNSEGDSEGQAETDGSTCGSYRAGCDGSAGAAIDAGTAKPAIGTAYSTAAARDTHAACGDGSAGTDR